MAIIRFAAASLFSKEQTAHEIVFDLEVDPTRSLSAVAQEAIGSYIHTDGRTGLSYPGPNLRKYMINKDPILGKKDFKIFFHRSGFNMRSTWCLGDDGVIIRGSVVVTMASPIGYGVIESINDPDTMKFAVWLLESRKVPADFDR